MSFTQKLITATIQINSGNALTPGTAPASFAGKGGANTVTLSGYRISAKIVKAGGNSQEEAAVRIYGLGLSLMNQLSTLGKTTVVLTNNLITLAAGDSSTGLSTIFAGNIASAVINLSDPPNGILEITAYAGRYQALQTVAPSSYQSAADAAVIMSGLATQGGLTFEKNGVSVMLRNPYFPGSLRSQMQACAEAANINWIIDDGKLAIWPKTGYRDGPVPLISPQTGLIGYPYPSGQDLLGLTTQFNPQLTFGGRINVQSSITPACGIWTICHLEHEIETMVIGGKWESKITGSPPGYLAIR